MSLPEALRREAGATFNNLLKWDAYFEFEDPEEGGLEGCSREASLKHRKAQRTLREVAAFLILLPNFIEGVACPGLEAALKAIMWRS